ncbi:MAG: hypothetical protein ACREUZ_09120, partial [Burkholderiales bacterium]
MKMNRGVFLCLAAGVAVAACSDALDIPAFANDAVVEADMAASAGDAIASAIADMAANEAQAGLQAISASTSYPSASAIDPTYTRTRTCYDAGDAVVVNCTPI